jgi:hypothetical protein
VTADPVALLGLVVVLDAVVIAGIVAGPLASLRSARQTATGSNPTIDEILVRDPFTDLADWRTMAGGAAGGGPTAYPAARAPSGATAGDPRTDGGGTDGNRSSTADDADRRAPATQRAPRPLVAVGPGNGTHEADEWRRALERERARVARYGGVATIMKVELDLEASTSDASGNLAQAESVLEGLVSTDSRASDFGGADGAGQLSSHPAGDARDASGRPRRSDPDSLPRGGAGGPRAAHRLDGRGIAGGSSRRRWLRAKRSAPDANPGAGRPVARGIPYEPGADPDARAGRRRGVSVEAVGDPGPALDRGFNARSRAQLQPPASAATVTAERCPSFSAYICRSACASS